MTVSVLTDVDLTFISAYLKRIAEDINTNGGDVPVLGDVDANYVPAYMKILAEGINDAGGDVPVYNDVDLTAFSSYAKILAEGIPSGGGYMAQAVHFAAGSYLARGGPLTGVSDSPKGTVFYWFRSDVLPDFLPQNIIASIPSYGVNPYDSGATVTFVSDGTNSWNFNNAEGGGIPDVDDGDWYGIARSWDTTDANSANWLYATVVGEPGEAPTSFLDGATGGKVGVGFSAKWADDDFYVMGDGSEDSVREVAQLWATPGVFMNAAALISAFWGADNKPKSLGTNGEDPTGSAPAVYCDGDASVWAINKGTGGAFSGSGTPIIDAVTSPSD